jgi:hypothetical protein
VTSLTVHHVPFRGRRETKAPLTWGQQWIWALLRNAGEEDSDYNIVGSFEVPQDRRLTQELCEETLAFFLSRHESLRTVIATGPDGPHQHVLREGRLEYQLVALDTATQLPQAAASWSADFAARRFDFATDLPVRLVLFSYGGHVRAGVYVFSHMAVDWYGLHCLLDEIRCRLRGEPLGPDPDDEATPVGLAAWQTSPSGRIKHARTLAHMENLYREQPPLPLPDDPDSLGDRPLHVQTRLISRAAKAGVSRLATTLGVTTSAVLHGTLAVVLRELTGRERIDFQLTSSQRFTRTTRTMVATLVLEGYFCVNVADARPEDVIRRCWSSAVTAHHNAGCDMAGFNELLARLGNGPDQPLRVGDYCFNDKRMDLDPSPVDPAAHIADLLRHSELTWPQVTEKEPFYVVVDNNGDALEVSLTFDTRHLSAAGAEKLLRGLELLIVQLADDGI